MEVEDAEWIGGCCYGWRWESWGAASEEIVCAGAVEVVNMQNMCI